MSRHVAQFDIDSYYKCMVYGMFNVDQIIHWNSKSTGSLVNLFYPPKITMLLNINVIVG